MEPWPRTPDELVRAQRALAMLMPPLWRPGADLRAVAGCFICFPRGNEGAGAAGDPGWAAAVLMEEGRLTATRLVRGEAGAGYEAGLLALREGRLLEAAVAGLPTQPDVLLVNATGRDHQRRAGLTVHLGAKLGIPTVGVTTRPLTAEGSWPADDPGSRSPLMIGDEVVGYWVRTRQHTRPLAVHAAWRTDPETAVEVVLRVTSGSRSPEPLRLARQFAREARAGRRSAAPVVGENGGLAFPPPAAS